MIDRCSLAYRYSVSTGAGPCSITTAATGEDKNINVYDDDISYIIPSCRDEIASKRGPVEALKEARKYLSGKNIHYRIELIDLNFARPHTFHVLLDHPIVNLWSGYYKAKS